MWFQIISELFVNLAAGWFGVALFEPQIGSINTFSDILWLIFKVFLGTISLFAAKFLREKTRRRKR